MKTQQVNATSPGLHLTEGATDDNEETQISVMSDLSMEGALGVGSEMERIHIQEKNKAMAAKLKVRFIFIGCWCVSSSILSINGMLYTLNIFVSLVIGSEYEPLRRSRFIFLLFQHI